MFLKVVQNQRAYTSRLLPLQ
jgi:hypothetical protein